LQRIKSFDAKLTGESIRRAKEIEKDIKALKKNILVKLKVISLTIYQNHIIGI